MSSGPQTWRMVLARETANTTPSFSTNTSPWSATDIGELVNASERRFSFKLNQPQTLSFSIPLTDPLADDIVTLTNEATSIPIIKLYRDTTLMMVTEIVSAEIASQGQVPTLAVVATETMWNRLSKRFIPDSKKITGYRIASTTDRTSNVMDQLTNINREPANLLPASSITSEFTDARAASTAALGNWTPSNLFWGSATYAIGAASGQLQVTGTAGTAVGTKLLIVSTPGTGSSMISVTPGTVYAVKAEAIAQSAALMAANVSGTGGVYLQINWFTNTTGTASSVVSATTQPLQTVTNTATSTLYAAAAAPSDANYAQVSLIISTTQATPSAADAVGYNFDNINFGPAPQTGILPGTATGFIADTFAGGPWYYKLFLEFVQEAGLTIGGFDFWQAPLDPVTNSGNSGTLTVDPYTTVSGTRRSFRGQARANAIFEYGTGRQNVTEYRFALSGDGLINVAYALPPGFPSGGSGTVSSADSTGTTRQRLREEVVSSDLQTTEARQAIANAHTSIRQRYKRVLTFTPQVEDGTRTPRFGLDYEIGDTVTARVKDQNSLLIDTTVRVYGADIEVDNQGMIRTNLTLVQEV